MRIKRSHEIVLGLRKNLAQFALLVAINALVGGMLGQERAVLPLIAQRVFHLHAYSAVLMYIVAFGVVKAITNFFAGAISERIGRKPVLIAGWILGIPVPFILAYAGSWDWIIVANVFLGLNQGLTWSTTVVMKIDLVGPQRRGLAMGLNEASGYGAVGLTALATGFLASHYGLRPYPFYLGMAFEVLGLALSLAFVRETLLHSVHEAKSHVANGVGGMGGLGLKEVFILTSLKEKALSAASQAGLVNNLNDGMAWGIFPVFFASRGLSIGKIGVLVALYPAIWGVGQLFTGGLSDRWGRKWLIVSGMLVQAFGILWITLVQGFFLWALGSIVIGLGTAMVYPTLLAVIGDVAHPTWRATSVGIYRLWRDLGFALGALLAGYFADTLGLVPAILIVALLTAISGGIVAFRMYETHVRLS